MPVRPVNEERALRSESQSMAVENSRRSAQLQAGIPAPRATQAAMASAGVPHSSEALETPFFSLKDVLIEDEVEQDLLSLFCQQRLKLPGQDLPAHPETDGLHGKPYFLKLEQDESIPRSLRALCGSHKMAENPGLSPEAIQNIEQKLRFIAHRCRQGNEEYREKVGLCSVEALECCDDRTAQFVSQMYGLAVIDELNSMKGNNVKDDVFNLGVSYAKLDMLREVTLQAISPTKDKEYAKAFSSRLFAKKFNEKETVEAALVVEHALQDELLLPTKHAQHRFGHLYGLNNQDIQEIKRVTVSKLLENYADRLIGSLCQWDPWVAYMDTDEAFLTEVARVRDELVEKLDVISSNPDLSESERLSQIHDCRKQFDNAKSSVLLGETRGYFLNHRVDAFLRNSKPSGLAPQIKGLEKFVNPLYSPMWMLSQCKRYYSASSFFQDNQDFKDVTQCLADLLLSDDGRSVPTLFECLPPSEGEGEDVLARSKDHPKIWFKFESTSLCLSIEPVEKKYSPVTTSLTNRLIELINVCSRFDLPFRVGSKRLVSAERANFWKPIERAPYKSHISAEPLPLSEERNYMLTFVDEKSKNPKKQRLFVVQYGLKQQDSQAVSMTPAHEQWIGKQVEEVSNLLKALTAPTLFFSRQADIKTFNVRILRSGDIESSKTLECVAQAIHSLHCLRLGENRSSNDPINQSILKAVRLRSKSPKEFAKTQLHLGQGVVLPAPSFFEIYNRVTTTELQEGMFSQPRPPEFDVLQLNPQR